MLYTEKMSSDNSEITKFLMTGRTWYFSFIRNIYSWIHVQGMKWVCFVYKLTEHKQYFLYLSKKTVICPLKPCIHRRGMCFDNVLGTVRISLYTEVCAHTSATVVKPQYYRKYLQVCDQFVCLFCGQFAFGGGGYLEACGQFLSSS